MQVELYANPFDLGAKVQAEVTEGQSVLEILGGNWPVRVMVGAREIPQAMWPYTRPHAGQVVRIYSLPQGGDSGILRAVAAVAVAVVSGGVAAGAIGGLSGVAASAAGAAVAIAGNLAINALIPPQMPEMDGGGRSTPDRGNSITGGQNRAARYEPIPRTYGRVRWFPPLAANYYTEAAGGDQYLRMLVCLGYGPLEVGGQTVGEGHSKITSVPSGTISIGETDIGEFDGVSYEIGTPDQITLYSRDILEIAPQVNFDTGANQGDVDSDWYVDNISATRTTEPDVDEISVDILWPQGLIARTERNEYSWAIEYSIEYSPAGENNWTEAVYRTVERKTNDAFRTTNRFNVPTGQYDVRVTRERTFLGTNLQLGSSQSVMTWSALRSIRDETPFDVPDTVLMALRIKASDQMEGVVDKLRIWQTSVLPVWDGSTWTDEATRNPAWAFADAMRGPQVTSPLSDSRIDLDALTDWADWAAAEGWTYDAVHDNDETIPQRLRSISAAGLASPSWNVAGKVSLVREKDSEPVHMITPRNSWGFSATRSFERVPHALRITYISEDDWQEDERVVFDDGYDEDNATRYETLSVDGLTNPDLVWRYGRRHLAQLRLRPETYTVSMDFENARFRRGDTVLLAHDVMLIGIGSGRIRAINGDTITLDQNFVLESGKSYVIRAQDSSGDLSLLDVETGSGVTNTLTISDASGLSVGDLVTVGESGSETLECKVAGIRYQADLEAEATLVPRATGILEADQGVIPGFDPNITQPVAIEDARPQPPVIDVARSDQTTLVVTQDGGFRPGLLVGWNLGSDRIPVDRIEMRYRTGEEWSTEAFGPTRRSTKIDGLPANATARIQMRSQSIWGVWSRWSFQENVTIEDASEPPTDVTGFDLTVQGDQAILSWDLAPDVDVRIGGRVLVYRSSSASLSEATPLDRLPGDATTATVPLLPGWYLAVFEDSGERQSETPAAIFTSAPQASKYNAVETYEEPPADGTVVSGITIDEDDALVLDDGEGLYETDSVVDLGQVYSSRVWAETETTTFLESDLISNRELISTWESISGTEEIKGPRAQVFVSTTEDDPSDSPEWSDWKRLTVGTFKARAYKVRIRLTRDNSDQGIRMTSWKLHVDMPDRTISDDEVTIPSGGKRIDFDPPFRAKPKVGITIEDAESGDKYRRTNTDRTGFDLEILDDSGSSVERTVDWIAVGYGYEE